HPALVRRASPPVRPRLGCEAHGLPDDRGTPLVAALQLPVPGGRATPAASRPRPPRPRRSNSKRALVPALGPYRAGAGARLGRWPYLVARAVLLPGQPPGVYPGGATAVGFHRWEHAAAMAKRGVAINSSSTMEQNGMTLAGRRALVTGAGRGIGRAC